MEEKNNVKNKVKINEKKVRNSRNRVYASIAKVKATIPGAVNEKMHEILMVVITLQKDTQDASEAIDGFVIISPKEVTKKYENKRNSERKINGRHSECRQKTVISIGAGKANKNKMKKGERK